MKKFLCLVLSVVILLGLTACKDNKKQKTASTSSAPVVASADSFKYHLSSDKTMVTITEYKGKDKNIIIPDKIEDAEVAAIGNAFAGSSIESIKIPATVKSISREAFKDCKKLHTVTLQKGIESIGDNAFMGCTALKNIELPDTLKNLGSAAFFECKSLKKIKIPKSVVGMGYEVFRHSGLSEVEFEDGIQNIGGLLSFWCYNLKSVTIPASVKSIDDLTFYNQTESITFLGDAPEMGENSIDPRTIIYYSPNAHGWYISPLKETHILAEIGKTPTVNRDTSADDYIYALNDNYTITIEYYTGADKNIVIPDKINGINVTQLYGFSSTEVPLESVEIPDTVEYIGIGAFSGQEKLHTVKLGKNIKIIDNNAFYKCTALKNIDLPKGLTMLGDESFCECKSLEKITIPNTVTDIHMDVFCYSGLKELNFEEGIKSIGSYACFWSNDLKTVTIPASVERIGEYSFVDPLKSATFLGDAPKEIGDNAFAENTIIYYNPECSGWDTTPLKDTNTLKPIEN